MRILKLVVFLFFSIFFSGCFVVDNPYSAIAPGPWRGTLQLEPNMVTPNPKGQPLPEKLKLEFEEVALGELPFNFEIVYENEQDFHLVIQNGSEKIRVDNIIYGRDPKTAKDTVLIHFPVYDSYIKAIYEENVMEGEWVVTNRGEYRIPFVAKQGKNHRFTTLKKEPVIDVSGKWEVNFLGMDDSDPPYKAIGEFEQKGNELNGTFITETGDYRYLQGTVQKDKLYLSTFDGAHAFLFEAKIQEDQTLIGSFRSGKHYRTIWEANRNPDFELSDPFQLTSLKEGYDQIDFSFEDPDGNLISLRDEKYKDKIKIVQIFGTWCPNSRDESIFLLDYLKRQPEAPIEVIALAFEKYRDKEKSLQSIRRFKERFKVPYDVLLAGYHEKEEASRSLPMLNQFISYPTMIFIDKNDQVRKIHTGFYGPATSQYEYFVKDFDQIMTTLMAE